MIEETRITFLIEAIADAQDLIKFIEAKTGIVITIIGAYAVVMFTDLDKIVKYYEYYDYWFFISLILFVLSLALSVCVVTRIIKPTSNPGLNITMGTLTEPNLKFFIPVNEYQKFSAFRNSEKHKLSINYESYYNTMLGATHDAILQSLTFELLKVSFIRNIKDHRLSYLLWITLIITGLFLITSLIFSVETDKAMTLIEHLKTVQPNKIKLKA